MSPPLVAAARRGATPRLAWTFGPLAGAVWVVFGAAFSVVPSLPPENDDDAADRGGDDEHEDGHAHPYAVSRRRPRVSAGANLGICHRLARLPAGLPPVIYATPPVGVGS